MTFEEWIKNDFRLLLKPISEDLTDEEKALIKGMLKMAWDAAQRGKSAPNKGVKREQSESGYSDWLHINRRFENGKVSKETSGD